MRFISTLIGILLIIFGTLLIPFPDYYNFQNDKYQFTVKKLEVKAEGAAKVGEEAKKEVTQVEAKGMPAKGQVMNITLDPLMGAISVLVGIILVFLGRRK